MKFRDKAEVLAMSFTVTYPWVGNHGLLTKILGFVKYLTLTGKHYTAPARLPILIPGIMANILNQSNVRIATLAN